jgi:dTDP-4-amino-4,6-dideoxygalactose transaminase
MIYYPKATHLQPAFSPYGFKAGDFPVAEALCNRILALPIFPGLTIENQMHIVDLVKSFINGIK